MIQKFKILFIFLLLLQVALLSCSSSAQNSSKDIQVIENIDKERYLEMIQYFTEIYNPTEEEKLRLEDAEKPYSIDDSLCFYLSKFIPIELAANENVKAALGKLLEKKYLAIRNYGTFGAETFAVYNMSIVTEHKLSNKFALNMIMGVERNIDTNFRDYALQGNEFVCIDSVVLNIDKIPAMKTDSIHQICMELVKNDKTGGCKW